MTMLAGQRRKTALPPIWPGDRYEVVCERDDPHGNTRDLYHFAQYAVHSARGLETAGLARRVRVVRLEDEVVIYDRVNGIDLPAGEW
ncbi:hypothetical protein SAMN05216276_1002191 [Streptosporangium subroseum]|uniref:Uncharacterized protein n=1 Tax=Streptosporangium subroseum TaxID=106412 RepID=A0A239AWV4_9ACTN|nr:hypothetical protein [Streptosporangium subroseum]SNR99812.1 hypothetical protein SAMN05216276_1002191 [Streptosporangium subroseum]